MRPLIIDDILSGGGNVSAEYYPGTFRAIGLKYKVSGVTVSNVRDRSFFMREGGGVVGFFGGGHQNKIGLKGGAM